VADEFEAIVIGTGFGGAVTACRLVEAGCKICVLERGRRYGPEDFPEFPTKNLFAHDQTPDEPSTSPLPDISRLLWSRDRGIYDIRDLGDAVSVQAAGYGGGSLVYANVHLRPPRDLFEHGWPEVYRNLDSYFDLAAYMLQVAPVPKRLAKTLQLERAAKSLREKPDPNILWFRTPLAVNFEPIDRDPFEHKRHACDMRGRCWLGCDIQAKNTLDLNYLARAERGDPTPDIRTLAEVTRITRRRHGGFTVTYTDHLVRDAGGNPQRRVRSVEGDFVFLCAGAVNSTELLLKNPQLFERSPVRTRLGSHYFPNADSLSVVFDCDEPHEADYGPTITSAVLFQRPVEGPCSRSLDFHRGVLKRGQPRAAAGQTVVGVTSKARAELTHDPILDWGRWRSGDAAGTLVFSGDAPFQDGEELLIGDSARAVARSQVAHLGHWFLAEDGGFPTDLEPLIGMFRSPLWLRRNRYLEAGERPERAPRRPAQAARLRVKAVANALGGTARRAVTPGGVTTRFFDQQQLPLTSTQVEIGSKRLPLADVLGDNLQKILPKWFLGALQNDRTQFLQNAAAAALPVIGRLLDVVARDLARQLPRRCRSSTSDRKSPV
jgi:hypothetical protein